MGNDWRSPMAWCPLKELFVPLAHRVLCPSPDWLNALPPAEVVKTRRKFWCQATAEPRDSSPVQVCRQPRDPPLCISRNLMVHCPAAERIARFVTLHKNSSTFNRLLITAPHGR